MAFKSTSAALGLSSSNILSIISSVCSLTHALILSTVSGENSSALISAPKCSLTKSTYSPLIDPDRILSFIHIASAACIDTPSELLSLLRSSAAYEICSSGLSAPPQMEASCSFVCPFAPASAIERAIRIDAGEIIVFLLFPSCFLRRSNEVLRYAFLYVLIVSEESSWILT